MANDDVERSFGVKTFGWGSPKEIVIAHSEINLKKLATKTIWAIYLCSWKFEISIGKISSEFFSVKLPNCALFKYHLTVMLQTFMATCRRSPIGTQRFFGLDSIQEVQTISRKNFFSLIETFLDEYFKLSRAKIPQ